MSNINTLIEDVYTKLECSDYIKDHCSTVYQRSKDITQYYPEADKNLIKAGCKLHDVGRTVTESVEHAYIGADLLRKLGVDERICLITERHIGAGITPYEARKLGLPDRNYMPESLEEKIVAHADNLVHGIKPVDLDFVIKKWQRKNMNPESIEFLKHLHEELLGNNL